MGFGAGEPQGAALLVVPLPRSYINKYNEHIYITVLFKPAGSGQPRIGASENHVFRAASPECRTGSAAEGYLMIGVAVSGGLDSLMALCLLKDEGHKVLAVHGQFVAGHAERLDGLRRACEQLEVPLEIVDLRAAFAQKIIEPFAAAYAAGATPNPCVMCNRDMKFGLLMEAARELGAERLATGHYARLDYFRAARGDFLTLGRAADASKDQAYFLGLVPAAFLQSVEFPLAGQCKADLRSELARRGLRAPESRESQEICFVPADDYRAFLLERDAAAANPGPMLLPDGQQVGEHQGLWQYTEGQRRGLGVAYSEPLYVIGKDMSRNVLILGTKAHLYIDSWRVADLNIHVPPEFWPEEVLARTRYRQAPQPATVQVTGNAAVINFLHPHERPAPGQLAAVYDANGLMLAAGIGAGGEGTTRASSP